MAPCAELVWSRKGPSPEGRGGKMRKETFPSYAHPTLPGLNSKYCRVMSPIRHKTLKAAYTTSSVTPSDSHLPRTGSSGRL
jgi:hypothetical protein